MPKAVRSYSSALTQFRRYLLDNDKKPTKVRSMVLEHACQLSQPFTADQLFEACKADMISIGTVYNTLSLLIDAQVIHAIKRQRGKAATEYEIITGTANRLQIVCKKCGRKADFTDPVIARMIKEHKYYNFNMLNYSLIVYGECKICRIKTIKRLIPRSRSSIE